MAKFDPAKTKNASMIKNMQEKASEQANSRTVIDVDINLIDENPDNDELFNMDDVDRLAHTIATDGFWGVIEVYKKPDGRYQISSGHQRVAALRQLGRSKAPVIVKSIPEKVVDVRRKLILSNIVGRNITPMELARCVSYHKETLIMEAMDEKGIIDYDEEMVLSEINMPQLYEVLAQTFGKSSRTIHYLEDLNLLIPELQELIIKETVSWSILSWKGVPKMAPDVQHKIFSELTSVARGSYTDLDGASLTRKQVEECVERVCDRLVEERELAKLREKAKADNNQVPVNDELAKKQLVESLKVSQRPKKKVVVPIQTAVVEETSKGTYEEEETLITVTAKPKRTADGILSSVSSQLESLLKIDFNFANEADAYKYISSIETSIAQIKERLV